MFWGIGMFYVAMIVFAVILIIAPLKIWAACNRIDKGQRKQNEFLAVQNVILRQHSTAVAGEEPSLHSIDKHETSTSYTGPRAQVTQAE